MDAQLFLQVTTGRSGLRASVNGVELFHDAGSDERESFTARVPLDHWLLPQGGNELSIEVTPQPGQVEPVCVAIVYPEDYKQPVFELRWSAPAGGDFKPFEASFPIHVTLERHSKLWLEATVLEPEIFDEPARAVALMTGLEWYAAFALKDLPKITELAEYRAKDVAGTYPGLSPEGVIDDYARAVGRPSFVLEPLSKDDIEMKVIAGGRAVLLSRGKAPWIRALPEKYWNAVTMPLCVALVDGKWVVAR